MRILISGITGLIGSHVAQALRSDGHTVLGLSRSAQGRDDLIEWSTAHGQLDPLLVDGFDAVVHLAGESIAGRWNDEKKQRIRRSRIDGTALLATTLAKVERKPQVFISASAVGYYGDRGEERLAEDAKPGNGFLAEVAMEWEQAADAAREANIRTVHPRFGMVLSPKGGALQQMLTPFRFGVGGRIGSGRQYWPWISLDDAAGVIRRAMEGDDLNGPVNAVAPDPPTCSEFVKALGRALRRPTVLPMPAFAARLVLGEFADAALLASTRAVPARLEALEYSFTHPTLDVCFSDLLR